MNEEEPKQAKIAKVAGTRATSQPKTHHSGTAAVGAKHQTAANQTNTAQHITSLVASTPLSLSLSEL
jgi:hypothetical protein